MSIQKVVIKVSTSGSAGSATGTGSAGVPLGELVDVYLDYNASAPGATTDVTIAAPGDPASRDLLVVTDNATDGWYPPGVQKRDSAGVLVTGAYESPVIHGGVLTVAVAQSNALTDAVIAYCYIRV